VGERRNVLDPSAGAEHVQVEDDGASPMKRARRDLVIEAARRSASPSKSPRTPSPTKLGGGGGSSVFKTPELPASALKSAPPPPPGAPTGAGAESSFDPRTPSPAHQGIQPDMSKTPVIDPDFFSHGPTFAASSSSQRRRSLSDTEGLPFPFFATTPKPPGEPRSPTLDAPPSASRGRVAKALVPPILTPGRPKWQKGHARRPSDPTPRAVSQAHMELSTITEASPEGHLTAGLGLEVITQQSDSAGPTGSTGIGFPSAPRINFPSDQPTATSLVTDLLGPALSGTRSRGGTSTPPCLSPSPSITESHSRFIPSAAGYPSRQARTVSAVSAASAVSAVTDVSAAPTDRTDRTLWMLRYTVSPTRPNRPRVWPPRDTAPCWAQSVIGIRDSGISRRSIGVPPVWITVLAARPSSRQERTRRRNVARSAQRVARSRGRCGRGAMVAWR
jgi:hypothetical protein